MRIVHTADFHLGSVQYNLRAREYDMYKAAEHVFGRAKQLKADLIILSGDTFDAIKPPANAVEFLQALITQTGIEVIGIDGNHDSADNNWLRVCGITPLRNGSVIERNGIRIGGLNSVRPSLFYPAINEMAESMKLDIFVMHQAVQELANAPFAEISAIDMLPAMKQMCVRYVAMGDIHDANERLISGVEFVYPGSTEMTKRDEKRNKKFYVVDITPEDLKLTEEPVITRPVVDVMVRTQDDIDNLLVELDKIPNAMVLITYDSAVRELGPRLKELMNGREVLYTITSTAVGKKSVNALKTEQTFDRKGAFARQIDAIRVYFEEASDEFRIVKQLLAAPGDVDTVVREYAKGRGVKL